MVAFPPCPPEARTAAETACGGVVELKELTNRRGSAVWKATGPVGTVAVKTGYDDAVAVTVREAAMLDALPGHEVTAGRYDGGAWLVTPWHDGPSTWKTFTAVRAGDGDRAPALRAAVELCRAVADLHASGWVHADLQPAHGIHTPDGVRLIDFAWSRPEPHGPVDGYRGGIVHLMAPELAIAARDKNPVLATRHSDVYALAGTLWTCASGTWPLDYQAAGIDRQAVGQDGIRDAIATGGIPLSPATWSTFHDALRPVLTAPPEHRPTAAELAQILCTVEQ
ncbi:hypothetical protein ABZX85_35700 [Streptomyces sp. NPDC004539]|uniref:hypothetical protein n=1 Tax=Streptomyces sp. NPDC004539 TaxID=3154280 RepID=UPI0033AB8A6F